MNRKQSTIISLVLFYMVSLLFFSIMPLPAFGVEITYSKPPLYSTSHPYIKYFLDRALDSSSEFAGLTRSFQIDLGGHSLADLALINYGAVSYDQTILGLIALDNNQTAILDTYAAYSKQLTDPNNPLFYAGSGYNVKYGPFRIVRILGKDVPNWWNTWDWAVDSGSAACLIEYALCAYQKTQNLDYKNLAVLLGDYILSLQDADGGVRMGPIGMWHPSGIYFYWNTKSTEQNERALYALTALAQVTGDGKYSQPITALENWLRDMYNKLVHLYHSAAQFNGAEWVKSDFGYLATDVIAFAPLELMFNDSYFGLTQEERDLEIDNMFAAIEERAAFFDAQNNPKLFRFSVSQNGDYGSVEWSSQMALAYLRVAQGYAQRGKIDEARGYLDKYNALLSNLEDFFIVPPDDPVAKVAPYASYVNGAVAGGVPTGTGYYTYNCQAALASTYYVFAKAGYDPSKLDGGLGIPILPEVDVTPPIAPIVSDEGQYTVKKNQLYAEWISQDAESAITEYQYKITQGSITGITIRDWTSTGEYNYVTAGALNLHNGKTYYFALRAKNGAGLWSEVGYSDGITLDSSKPCIINRTQKMQSAREFFLFQAKVWDRYSGVKSVYLSLEREGAKDRRYRMNYNKQSKLYQARLPLQCQPAIITYRIEAKDKAGNKQITRSFGLKIIKF